MHIVASIQARLGSTRLPGKVLFHLGDRRLLQWVVDRTTIVESIDKPIVAIGDQPENDAVKTYCDRTEIDHLIGPENDLLERHQAVADRTGCDLLVRITADCPFVPSDEIERVIEEHLENDAWYTTNMTDKMPVGTAVDVIEPILLEELDAIDEDHPVKLPRSNPREWKTVWTDNPSWHAISDTHIAVDTPEDYWTLSDAVDTVGSEPRAVANWVAER